VSRNSNGDVIVVWADRRNGNWDKDHTLKRMTGILEWGNIEENKNLRRGDE